MKNIQWIKQKPIAHRGLWSEDAPENSLKAFQKAVDAHHPIELDVQMTVDGKLIVFHDWSFERMCGVRKCVMESMMQEISTYQLKNSQEHVPMLQDVLRMVNGRVPLLIEMKNRKYEKNLFLKKIHESLRVYGGLYALSSFDPFMIKKAKTLFPHVLCGLNFSDYKNHGVMSGWIRKNVMYGAWIISGYMPDFFACRASMLPQCWIVRVAKRNKRILLAWGVRDHKQYVQMSSVIDNVIFDPIDKSAMK